MTPAERAVFRQVVEALQLARIYVQTLHANVEGATGKRDNLILPDLQKVDSAITAAKEIL